MAFYAASVEPAAPGTTNDVLTLTSAANRRAWIHEVSVCGLGTSSAANSLAVRRVKDVGITPTAQVPVLLDPEQATASTTIATGWTTQPSLSASTVPLLRLGANSNGGVYRWVAKPGQEIAVRNDVTSNVSQISLRFTTGGAGPMGVHMIFEE